MKRWGKKLAGFLLLLVGVAMFLGNLGSLIGFLIAAVLFWYGVKKLKTAETKGSKIFAFMVLGLSLLVLFGMLPGVIPLIFGGICFYFGFKLMKTEVAGLAWETGVAVRGIPKGKRTSMADHSFEADWQEFVKRQKRTDWDIEQF
ncbi:MULTISPECIES: hypothetical protein [unclassified Thermoactinomyces]|jgi:hypothetical protein|uniref:hypothetical protein n=1 Tax=unclassified Thermoactinomyces TaxID=2634588 RepID=UPI0018DD490A|nr:MULTISPECIES: hypothetical protein [unclassified Thermoactinomyces]MBH8597957.1 hypothetical protein [Thermoactinomyces sp. CICC 10523]MBH8604311.1 hypothetical protein [Thermoactinomyces sp. CICC 10522]